MKIHIRNTFIIVLGVALVGVSINMFLGPHHIAAGGVSGIGILAEAFFGIDRAIVVLVLNGVMILLAAIFLGKAALLKILFGSLLLPAALAVIPEFMVVDDQMLSVLFGSGIFALGVAMLYQIGASSGGTTVPPLIFKKYFGMNTSIGLLLTDLIIVVFNILVFNMTSFFFAVLSLILTSVVMSYIESGLNRKKALMIISKTHVDEITDVILSSVDRGVTIFDGIGAYTKEDTKMLFTVVANQDYRKAVNLINSIDEKAFVVSYNISDVHGLGFTYQNI